MLLVSLSGSGNYKIPCYNINMLNNTNLIFIANKKQEWTTLATKKYNY